MSLGAHAREWLSPATVLFIFDAMLKEYRRGTTSTPKEATATNTDDSSREITCLLTKYDFYFLPLLNPDGYEFTHTAERFWRKNRRPFYDVDEDR